MNFLFCYLEKRKTSNFFIPLRIWNSGTQLYQKNSQFIYNENISLLKVVADFIEEKTAIDDRQHGGEVDGQVVVNITLATSQANMYR